MRIVISKGNGRATCLCNEDVPYQVRPITGERMAQFMVTVVYADEPNNNEVYRLDFTEAGGLDVTRMM